MGSAQEYAWDLRGARVAISVSANSDRGLVRRVNEDSFVASPPIFVVADGMGGHSFGDRASQATVRVLSAIDSPDAPTTPEVVLAAVADAHRAVQEISEDEFAGTTLTGVAFVQPDADGGYYWMAFNIGDSRVYSWDGSTLTQVSVDHSAVQELVDDGVISQAEASVHPDRNVITRAIGVDADLDPDVWLLPAGGAQTFVICSDGLTKELDDIAIARVLEVTGAAESAADRLVAAALASGGGDNVTVLVVSSMITSTVQPEILPAHLEATRPRT